MPRYTDIDVLLNKLPDDLPYKASVKRVLIQAPTAEVVPKSEEGAECPTCHGTGRIGTTDWLTKGLSKKQLAEEKAKAIAEHEQHIKTEVAREIFEEIEKLHLHVTNEFDLRRYDELKKKYTGKNSENKKEVTDGL